MFSFGNQSFGESKGTGGVPIRLKLSGARKTYGWSVRAEGFLFAQFQVFPGVRVANALDQIADHFRLVRDESVLHPTTQKIAQDPPEILVAWEG